MNTNQKEIIDAGCSYKEIRRLTEMKRLKKHPIQIKAKELSLYFTAVYRINMAVRGKRKKGV